MSDVAPQRRGLWVLFFALLGAAGTIVWIPILGWVAAPLALALAVLVLPFAIIQSIINAFRRSQ